MKRVALCMCAFLLANVLTLLTVMIERTGPELRSYGNLCGPALDGDCLKPALKAGFPFAYLFDKPGISVEHQLAFVEDEFLPMGWLLDAGVYFVVLLFIARVVRRSGQPGSNA